MGTLPDLPKQRKRVTGFIYDTETEKHRCLWDPIHIEKPDRSIRIVERLSAPPDTLTDLCQKLESRLALDEEIALVHTDELIKDIHEVCSSEPGENNCNLKEFSAKYDDVYVNKESERCALIAAGCTIELVDAIVFGEITNGLAVVRPPGHHASSTESNGFCLYNNVAIAAKHLLENRGIQRILIVDWDVHHGQGTQRVFYDDPRVLYFSTHTYEDGVKWPFLRESNFDAIGEGDGTGFNINIPLNRVGMGDAEYLAFFTQVLMPVALEYNPEVVIVSAGYDAAIGCPEGRMMVSPAMYGHMTSFLNTLAAGKVAVVLEGGYCLDSLSEGVACTLEALLGFPSYPLPALREPDELAVTAILNVISWLRKHWKSLAYQDSPLARRTRSHGDSSSTLPLHTPVIFFNPPNPLPFGEAYCCTHFYSCVEVVELRHEIQKMVEFCAENRTARPNSLKTGYVYDEIMLLHTDENQLNPERPDRIRSIHDYLEDRGYLDRCTKVPSRQATAEELALFHDESYVSVLTLEPVAFAMEAQRRIGGAYGASDWSGKESIESWSPDVYASEGSQPAVMTAAGSLLNLVDGVVKNELRNGFAIIRPPGHHAHSDCPAGFCYANNVVLAAKHALNNHALNRILIVDWDVHHGDGVQEAFYSDPRVLYISLHRGEVEFYPAGVEKLAKFSGEGAGKGFNVNIPWQSPGRGDGDYLSAFWQLIVPLAYEFAPELVLVSCGFDAARNDPLGRCNVSPVGYSLMTRLLSTLAGGKMVLALEGGYNLESLKQSSEAVVRSLLGDPVEECTALVPSSRAVEDIKAAVDAQRNTRVWKSLQYRVVLEEPVDGTGAGDS